jgi:hypothetical protein
MLKTNISSSGPLSETQANMDKFCLNLIYSGACHYTVQAYQLLEKAEASPTNEADIKFYLETLFARPLEENV